MRKWLLPVLVIAGLMLCVSGESQARETSFGEKSISEHHGRGRHHGGGRRGGGWYNGGCWR